VSADLGRDASPVVEEPDLPLTYPQDRKKRRRAAVVAISLTLVTAVAAATALASLVNKAGDPDRIAGLDPSNNGQAPASIEELGVASPSPVAPSRDIGASLPRSAIAIDQTHSKGESQLVGPPAPTMEIASIGPKPSKATPEGAVQPGPGKPVKATLKDSSSVKRRRSFTEAQLLAQLASVPEVKTFTLPVANALVQSYFKRYRAAGGDLSPNALLRARPDLFSLTLLSPNQLRPRDAQTLQTLSRELRFLLQQTTPSGDPGRKPLSELLETILRSRKLRGRPEWLRPEAVPALLQLLMHEDRAIRLMLIELLADIQGPVAEAALAQRAVVDLAPDVRDAALRALRERPRVEARRVFIRYLRYPWAPVADHAAEALVYLHDEDAVPSVVALLRRPDPAGPLLGTKGKTNFQELVRIPHETNCLICHPAALSARDPVSRSVPGVILALSSDRATLVSTSQLPLALQGLAEQTVQSQPTGGGGGYSRGGSGGGSGSSGSKVGPLYVRADVTFFRQDFSLSELLGAPGIVGVQKFRSDFLLRTRPAREDELKGREWDPVHYEQREAALWALRELTGKDLGSDTNAWVALYPRAEFDADAASLADELVRISGTRREKLLTRMRDGEGDVYTESLAAAIPRLAATAKTKARAALTERLMRLPTGALAENLRDQDPEIRRAAALASASNGCQDNIPDLEPLLKDPNPPVAAAARDALRQLTGKDPAPVAADPVEMPDPSMR